MKSLFRKKASTVVGLDIGTKFVKGVCLDMTNPTIELIGFAAEPIVGVAFNERDVQDYDAVGKAIKKVTNALKSKSKDVVLAVAGSNVISKKVYMDPDQSDYEMEVQIELEADSLIPYPLEEVYLDFEQLGEKETHPDKVEVLLSTAHRDIVDKRITLVREAALEPIIVDIETNALADALIQFSHSDFDDTQVIINVGASMMQICVVEGNEVIYVKEHSFGANMFVQELALMHAMEIQEIERQIADSTAPESWFKDSLSSFIASLQQQIQRALQMFVSTTHRTMPSHLYLTGGVGALPNIATELSNDMNMRVEIFNPFDDIAVIKDSDKQNLALMGPQFSIAAGLASRRLSQWQG
ncbi:MAG: type IV pilus assembly protein PilM [Pseudomonadota bacterium]